jgi:hypothetical protein
MQIPRPSPFDMIKGKQALFIKFRKKLDRKKWIASRFIMSQCRERASMSPRDPVRIESFEWDRADDAGGNTAHISRHGISPEDVEEALTSIPLVLRGPDGRATIGR